MSVIICDNPECGHGAALHVESGCFSDGATSAICRCRKSASSVFRAHIARQDKVIEAARVFVPNLETPAVTVMSVDYRRLAAALKELDAGKEQE